MPANLVTCYSPKTNFAPLLDAFDAVGWVPCVRGELSSHVFGDKKSVLGDVDNYSAEFKDYVGSPKFDSVRYLAATSLFTFDDKKADKKGQVFRRTVRFAFHATVNDKKTLTDFFDRNFADPDKCKDARKLFEEMRNKDRELMVGRLSMMMIPTEETRNRILTSEEKALLESMSKLDKKREKYEIAAVKDAEHL
jgi:hypothetical protein